MMPALIRIGASATLTRMLADSRTFYPSFLLEMVS